MAKILKTIAPIDSVSGAFGKREQSLSGKVIISNVRKKGGNWNGGAGFMYMSCLTKTTYAGTADQLIANDLFGRRAVAVKERLANPEYINADKTAFLAQTTYKTLRSFVWSLVMAQITE